MGGLWTWRGSRRDWSDTEICSLLYCVERCHGDGGDSVVVRETWEGCGRREVLEETGLTLRYVRYCTVVNAIAEEVNYHYITLFVTGQVDTAIKTEPENMEPEKCLGE